MGMHLARHHQWANPKWLEHKWLHWICTKVTGIINGFQLRSSSLFAPAAAGEIETWVSPNGRDLVTRGPDGLYRYERGTHGGRGGQNSGDPSTRRGWRRIASADDGGQGGSSTMAQFLRG